MIERVKVIRVNGDLEVAVYHKSGKVKYYTKDPIIAEYTTGVNMIPKTVVEFMRQHPNKVWF